ncbi:hypothetical protein [Kineosporia babensis]|uniref:Uncharacterized protein n=1 Tax=Kineosporia babensis TaxID=499548 RepID=A0A9X1SUC7_9ACTN|nr:hypothetical protein [Kineosporia babensis]MCD5311575.1 hypothetical protein [Kineosporia babensis]
MIVAILTAEIGFWVFLLGGLLLRYLLRRNRLSTFVLACVPLVDLALLAFVTIDIARGAEPSRAHALAAVYLGFTVAFGHRTISWADAWFQHRFAGGPRPVKPPKGSRAAVRALWVEWARVVLTAVIAAVGLGLMILAEGHGVPQGFDEAAQHPYWSTLLQLGMIVLIWFLAGPAFAGRGRAGDDGTGEDPAADPAVRERPGTRHR